MYTDGKKYFEVQAILNLLLKIYITYRKMVQFDRSCSISAVISESLSERLVIIFLWLWRKESLRSTPCSALKEMRIENIFMLNRPFIQKIFKCLSNIFWNMT